MSDKPIDLQISSQPDTDKDYFNFKATGLKLDKTYAFKFQWIYPDGKLSEWSSGYILNTPTEQVPGAPSASVPSTSVGNIPVTLSTFPTNAKRVDIYVIGGTLYGTGKVVDSFLSAGTKTISISEAGVYQVSLITVTPSGVNGNPTNTFTITVTGQQQVVEAPTLPTGLSVAPAPFAVSVNWGGQYSGSGFEGFKSIDIHVRGTDVGSTATSGFSTATQVATLTVDSTTNRQNIGLDNLRQALSLLSNTAAYTAPMFFYYIARNENDELYKVSGTATYTRINSSTVNPTQANFVDIQNGVISIENLVAGNGQFSSWLRTGTAGGARIELSGTDNFTPSGESIVVKKGITAYSTGSTEIFRLDIGSTPKLTIRGDGEFTGDLTIGSGNNIFKAEPLTGIWLGNASFASAPFSVSKTGVLTAQSGTIGGWAINSTQIRSNGANQISLNPSTPKIALVQGSTLNATTGLYEGGTEKITIDPIEGIVGPNITYDGQQVPSFKLTPAGNLTLYGSINITGGQAQTDINTATTNASNALSAANSKIRSYYQNDEPTGGTYVTGDLWFELDNGNKAHRWSGSQWVAVQDTKVTNALQKGGSYFIENASNQLTQINSNGITISSTGFSINTDTTATVGASKLVINSAGITARDGSNNTTFIINALTGDAEFKGSVKSGSTVSGSRISTGIDPYFGSIRMGYTEGFGSGSTLEVVGADGSVYGQLYQFNNGNEVILRHGSSREAGGFPTSSAYLSLNPNTVSLGYTNSVGLGQYELNISADGSHTLLGTMSGLGNGSIALSQFRNISAGSTAKNTGDSSGYVGDIYIQF